LIGKIILSKIEKHLITSGCSFTQNTWPNILSSNIGYTLHNEGLGSQGNGLISKRLIYRITELLKTVDPSDLLVGIMWSGFTRHEIFVDPVMHFDKNEDGWMTNPVKFIDDKDSNGSWVILNHGWSNDYAKRFYSDFNLPAGVIQTIEHILRTQWFLTLHGIKYFMTTFTSETLPSDIVLQPEVKWLYDQIDFDNFLPILGEYEWCNNGTQISAQQWPPKWKHPTMEQHQQFVEQVVVPHLKKMGFW
jgi:hypothetical protein